MNFRIFALCTLCAIQSYFGVGQSVTPHIHIDQFGYTPEMTKVAVISDPIIGFDAGASYMPGNTLQIRDHNNQVVFAGSPTVWNGGAIHPASGNRGWWFDFSGLQTPGLYHVYDPTTQLRSHDFEINAGIYYAILKAAAKMFYYNRCGFAKETPYADSNWTDGINFPQDTATRYIGNPSNSSLFRDLSGGWWDAGDYNKYVTFALKPVHQLLYAYEDNPLLYSDDWNIPESGNGLPDLLDEIKWELDWLLKMINPDGSVIIKMGGTNYQNSDSPPSSNTLPRYYGETCTSSAIAMAGMLAHAAIVYDQVPDWQDFADTLETQAIACWNHVLPDLISNTLDTDCDDGTINAGDADRSSTQQRADAVLAAIFLFEKTGVGTYNTYVSNNINDISTMSGNWVDINDIDVIEACFRYTTLPANNSTTSAEILNSCTPHIIGDWNGYFGFNAGDLYRANMPEWNYHWGSNRPKAEYGILNHLVEKYSLNASQNASYRLKTSEQLHYFHGVNPLHIVMLSNMYDFGGDSCANEIYHAWFADGTDYDHALTSMYGPAPGYVVGGPNKDFSITSITPPANQPRQKAYLDFNDGWPNNSWEISEPSIYYQAVYLRLLALFSENPCKDKQVVYVDQSANGQGNGFSWLDAYPNLYQALADECIEDIDTIYIAEGTYIPESSDRSYSYPWPSNILLTGSYPSGGGSPDLDLYPTQISGNIGALSTTTDNLYHTVQIGIGKQVTLRNLIIVDGNANGSANNVRGGGIYNEGTCILDNVIIRSNQALEPGSEGVYSDPGATLSIKSNCTIKP